MNRARDITPLIAICASLIAHAFIVYAVAEYFTRQNGWRIWLPPLPRIEAPVTWLVKEPEQQFPVRRPDNDMGDSTGTGDANNAIDGDQPQQAPAAPEVQAFLSRDPSGAGFVGDAPSPSVAPESPGSPGSDLPFGVKSPAADQVPIAKAAPKPPPIETVPADPPPAESPVVAKTQPSMPAEDSSPIGIAMTEAQKPQPTTPQSAEPKPQDPKVEIAAATPPQQPSPQPDDNQPDAVTDTPAIPATPPAADPAPQSDSESDPFSKIGSVEFRPGKVDVRFGRKVKTTRPHLTLAGQYDLAAQAAPRVMLKVKTDETGKVIDVAVIQSSGSNEIDAPCQRAVYDWWFEPPKDASGKPVPDVILFTIDFRRI